MSSRDSFDEQLVVHVLEDVFSTGKTPEATYTPRTGIDTNGATFDDQLKARARRRNGGVMIFGVSKSGKTSLVERVLPEKAACWLQGTRIATVNDFWNTLAQQLNIAEKYTSQTTDDQTHTEGDKFEVGVKGFVSTGFENSQKASQTSSYSWSYSNVVPDEVEAILSSQPRPIVIDDFHHISKDVRTGIAKAIKPLLRTTFIVIIAIPSHSFDPAKMVTDIGGRMTHFEIPEWTEEELRIIAHRGFEKLNLLDPDGILATRLARCSFGSPHVMQELCYVTLSDGLGIRETVNPSQTLSIPKRFNSILRISATQAEPFAFETVLRGRNTKGTPRKPIALKSGGTTDSYGITLMAVANVIPPLKIDFRRIRAAVNALTNDSIAQERIGTALAGMSDVAGKNKGDSDPIFSYRGEVAYIEDPLFAYHLKYGDWMRHAIRQPDPENDTLF